MTGSERIAKASKVADEVQSILGDDFYVGKFSRLINQPGILVARPFLLPGMACIDRCELLSDKYEEIIKSRIIGDLKHQIALLEDAVKKLEAHNVKPS